MKNTANIKDQYFMDDPRESERLVRKVNAHEFVSKYLKKHIDDLEEGKILEAGCGPGAFLRIIGDNYPNNTITGIDLSYSRTADANTKLFALPNAKAICADIYELPFPDDHFDLIYSRFLFEYLKYPEIAAKELFRVCKPGGKLLLQDLDSQFTFYPALSPKITRVLQTLKEHTGFDPDIGRKLFSIARSGGFTVANTETEIYHNVFGQIDKFNYDLWKLKLDIALENRESMLGNNVEELKAEILESLRNENSVMFSFLFTITAIKA